MLNKKYFFYVLNLVSLLFISCDPKGSLTHGERTPYFHDDAAGHSPHGAYGGMEAQICYPSCRSANGDNPDYDPDYSALSELGDWLKSVFKKENNNGLNQENPQDPTDERMPYDTRQNEYTNQEIERMSKYSSADVIEEVDEANRKLDEELKQIREASEWKKTVEKKANSDLNEINKSLDQLTGSGEVQQLSDWRKTVEDSKDRHNQNTESIANSIGNVENGNPNKFQTSPSSPNGRKVRDANAYANRVEKLTNSLDVNSVEGRTANTLLKISRASIVKADEFYAAGQESLGDAYYEFAIAVLDTVASFTPGVGWAKDTFEAITGKNMLTGEELTEFERSMAIVGSVTGGVGSKAGKGLKILKNMAEASGEGAHAAGTVEKVFGAAEKILDSAMIHKIDLKKADASRLKNNPLNDTKYTDKVRRQMQEDKFHGFPLEVDNFGGIGNKTEIIGGDGIKRTKISVEGEYLSRQGNFEWIVEPDGLINHRKFEPLR